MNQQVFETQDQRDRRRKAYTERPLGQIRGTFFSLLDISIPLGKNC